MIRCVEISDSGALRYILDKDILDASSLMGSTDSSALSTPYSITDDRVTFFDQSNVDNYYQWSLQYPHGQPVLASSFVPSYSPGAVDPESLWLADKASRIMTQNSFSKTGIETSCESTATAIGSIPRADVPFEAYGGEVARYTPRQIENDRRVSDVMLPRLERAVSSSSLERTHGGQERTAAMVSTQREHILEQPPESNEYHAYWPPDSPVETHDSVSRRSSAVSSQSGTPFEDDRSERPMSLDGSTTCTNCLTQTTPLWRRDIEGAPLCNACGLYCRLHGMRRPLSLKTDVIKRRNRSSASKTASSGRDVSSGRVFRSSKYNEQEG
ncbi:uncharacterized protein LY89DRAFT_725639 [Mollisia scopiformis]|uniref:GATA-type domain-containing protein n=1 Tax=Mollisia scopiformis TaxID=149040 RepID=A0A132B725_MOLSC|nr:uncharacterized protein LY89DRAFT_725639 [Mollisia scopiformis]KUJ07477.1 hypothetical protein LY89DRAFT_725639 [Mollisia scopiformis]